MKFLVVDDTCENIEAAQEAAKMFQDHEFMFVSSAAEALKRLPQHDVLISDLFLPQEDDETLQVAYRSYLRKVAAPKCFPEIVEIYYEGTVSATDDPWVRAEEKQAEALYVLRTGRLEKLWAKVTADGYDYASSWRRKEMKKREVKESSQPLLAYGAPLMLQAQQSGMRHVLITDLHRHAGALYSSQNDAVDGIIVLAPLVDAGMMTVMQALCNGSGSLTYIGCGAVPSDMKSDAKTRPAAWEYAYEIALQQ